MKLNEKNILLILFFGSALAFMFLVSYLKHRAQVMHPIQKSIDPEHSDTIVSCYNHYNFEFIIKCACNAKEYFEPNYSAWIKLKNNKEYFLFETYFAEHLNRVHDSVFSYPYKEMGNCLQCTGEELIIVTDTVICLGRVGFVKNERFYVLVDKGYTNGHASMEVDTAEVFISEDGKRLIYPLPYNEL